MSTRGLIGFKNDDVYKVMYCHSDSYPKGLGDEVVDFINKYLQNKDNIEQLKENVSNVVMVEQNDTINDIDCDNPQKLLKMLYNKIKEFGEETTCYQLLRDFQGIDIVKEIFNGNISIMHDDFEFFEDSLFMEYGYVINLDDETLDLYRGFNKFPMKEINPLYGRIKNEQGYESDYYPAKFVGSFPINSTIPDDWKNIFDK
ncbi:MAG: hypothetical protein ACOCRX_01405 [Candidatus Woesearchaeota archaeon]